jgi:N-acetylglucosamine-6-phosphate deacetylase
MAWRWPRAGGVTAIAFRNGAVFDGARVWQGHAIRFERDRVAWFGPGRDLPRDTAAIDLDGDFLSPGFVDLQVNGGGGAMLNAEPTIDGLRRIAAAHRTSGVVALLPTLITDTPEITSAAIAAATEAVRLQVPGIGGLHLEGPHLAPARAGAHDPALIRPMGDADLAALCEAAAALPCLKVTLAPEAVTEAQTRTLARAGVLVALGHSDIDYDGALRHAAAGARCVTHLFNAMRPLGHRAPGLVGAALASPDLSAGLIADGIHVHPEMLRIAWAAKRRGKGDFYLVSDAMAVAGTDLDAFTLGGRRVARSRGRLTLADGTLAGADLDPLGALQVLVRQAGVPLKEALAAATRVPAALAGLPAPAAPHDLRAASLIRISADLTTVGPAIPRDQSS